MSKRWILAVILTNCDQFSVAFQFEFNDEWKFHFSSQILTSFDPLDWLSVIFKNEFLAEFYWQVLDGYLVDPEPNSKPV